jgi:hypothetical protein
VSPVAEATGAYRLTVTLAEAPTDVLVWLAGQPRNAWWPVNGVRDAVAPDGADDALGTTARALALLIDGGYVEGASMDDFPGYRATEAGRAAVAEASAKPDPSASTGAPS